MEQQASANEVSQELMTQASPFGGAFDETGNIRDYEAAVLVDANYAEVWVQCREGVVGYLGSSGRYCADKGRLTRVRHSEKTDICEHFELELELAALAGLSACELARCAVRARLEVEVAQ